MTSYSYDLNYQDILSNYHQAMKILNNTKNWQNYGTLSYWRGKKGEKLGQLHKLVTIELFYHLLSAYSQDTEVIYMVEIYKWILQTLGEDIEKLSTADAKTWREKINLANQVPSGEKPLVTAAIDIVLHQNPIVWLEFYRKEYLIKLGNQAANFYESLSKKIDKRVYSYLPPSPLPTTRKASDKYMGSLRYGEIEIGSKTIQVWEILEKRHLWLRQNAYQIAKEMTANDDIQEIHPYQQAIYQKRASGNLSKKQKAKIKAHLGRIALLQKLQDFPSQENYPLDNLYYSQPSGRIEPQWLHPSHISKKSGKSATYPGGVRQAIFAANQAGLELSASDCNASAWQIVSLFLADAKTHQIACSHEQDFNTIMTEKAINGDYFLPDKLQNKQDENFRTLVKQLLMTVLYGSNPKQQYHEAKKIGLGDYWQPGTDKCKNGAVRFLHDCSQEFPVLTNYVKLMQKVAKIACKKLGSFKLPYLFESHLSINFDYPKAESKTITCIRNYADNKSNQKTYSFNLQYPQKPREIDQKRVTKALPPLLIHSIDSAIIKHLIILLDQKLPPEYGFATIHDCIIFPKTIIDPVQIQQLWNQAWRLTYQQFGTLYDWIIYILQLDSKNSQLELKSVEIAYTKWQKNLNNPAYLQKLWLNTSIEY